MICNYMSVIYCHILWFNENWRLIRKGVIRMTFVYEFGNVNLSSIVDVDFIIFFLTSTESAE